MDRQTELRGSTTESRRLPVATVAAWPNGRSPRAVGPGPIAKPGPSRGKTVWVAPRYGCKRGSAGRPSPASGVGDCGGRGERHLMRSLTSDA